MQVTLGRSNKTPTGDRGLGKKEKRDRTTHPKGNEKKGVENEKRFRILTWLAVQDFRSIKKNSE